MFVGSAKGVATLAVGRLVSENGVLKGVNDGNLLYIIHRDGLEIVNKSLVKVAESSWAPSEFHVAAISGSEDE
ncbi:hypothetical protein L6452_06588 [Arctium lappa]|uniref:Uncharacterized protein n=1 Tax=Arctium lappa TaxID=4217 RepID=A0ACB9EJN1_ARCLA|nr:hypothetical protein L6452_06588 [Arctium lappa]